MEGSSGTTGETDDCYGREEGCFLWNVGTQKILNQDCDQTSLSRRDCQQTGTRFRLKYFVAGRTKLYLLLTLRTRTQNQNPSVVWRGNQSVCDGDWEFLLWIFLRWTEVSIKTLFIALKHIQNILAPQDDTRCVLLGRLLQVHLCVPTAASNK